LPRIEQEFTPPTINVQRRKPTESEIVAAIENDPKVIELKREVEYYKSLIIELEANDLARFDRQRFDDLQKKRLQSIADLEAQRGEARSRAVAILDQLADEDLEQRKLEAEAKIAQLAREHRENISLDLAQQTEADRIAYEDLTSRLTVLEKSYEEERQRLEQFGGESSQLQFAQQELDLETETLKKLRERVAAFRTEKQNSASVRTLAPAQVPKTPVESVPIKKMFVASAAAFVVPFLFGFLWEFKVQRVTDSRAVENAKLAPVVGEVAKLPAGGRAGKGRRMFEESVDTLRANLFMSVDTKDTRTIAVVSSMSGEGKSSVASQLALSIAKATGKTVLLVDTDLRCPDQHEIFGIDSGPGLTAVLTGAATLKQAVNTSLGDLIHVLPAGHLDRSPHRLMSPDAMRKFVTSAMENYSYVIFDTAPVLSAGETLAVASVVDSTLLCVMRDVSRLENVTRTTRRLEASGARIAGTVFSGVSARQYSYRYGDYHYAAANDFPA
jgi:capsular exopolysaccharide synthesis family protein